jgi:hypothetical protein
MIKPHVRQSISDLDAGNREVSSTPYEPQSGQHVSKVPKSNIDSITIRPLRWQGS